jgi:hypothetical protein
LRLAPCSIIPHSLLGRTLSAKHPGRLALDLPDLEWQIQDAVRAVTADFLLKSSLSTSELEEIKAR